MLFSGILNSEFTPGAWRTAPVTTQGEPVMSRRATMLITLPTLLAGALLTAPLSSARAAEPPKGAPPRAPELFMAIGQGNLAGVKALLASGVNPNARNTIHMSALMIASGTGNVE